MTSPLGHIGRYELLAKLGAGGMGEVYLARATGTGGFEKRVVIKRILPHLADDPEFVARFIAEGKLVVRLRHAGIAQVLDMGEQDGATFIAMEHVDGRDLGELVRLARSGGVETPIPLVVTVFVKLLEALDYAHHATDDDGQPLGIIHRDVSPSNVMIAKTGEVKLLDFGIARATERLQATTTGAIRGKYSYMSPQQAAGADLDERSDLFSVGVMMWELLAGHRPFDGASDLLTLDRIRFFDPGPLVVAAPDVPGAVGAVVDRLLAKDPDARFPTAEAAMRALLAWLNDLDAVILARDISAWLDAVLKTLPEALRQRSTTGMSLDDVLLLGLGSDAKGTPAGTEPPARRAPFTRTVSAPSGPSSRSTSRPSTPNGAAGAPPGQAGVGESSPPPGPVTPSPVAAALPALSSIPADSVTAPAAAPPRARRGVLALLVVLNLLLLGAVAWLIARAVEGDSTPPPLTAALVDGRDAPDAAGTTLATATEDVVEADTVAAAPVDVVEAPLADASSLDAAAPMTSGAAFGELVATLGDSLLPADATLTIRATPGGQVAVTGFGAGPSPRVISGRPGTVVRGRVTLDDYTASSFDAVLGQDAVVHVTLKPMLFGTLTFRFEPSGAEVFLDGAPFPTETWLVTGKKLAVGPHALKVVFPGGQHIERSFTIAANKDTNLKTLKVGGGSGGGE